jgi:hypothetical protein
MTTTVTAPPTIEQVCALAAFATARVQETIDALNQRAPELAAGVERSADAAPTLRVPGGPEPCHRPLRDAHAAARTTRRGPRHRAAGEGGERDGPRPHLCPLTYGQTTSASPSVRRWTPRARPAA